MAGISLNFSSASLTARSAYSRATDLVETSLERLSTGKRINRGADDPSGLIAAEGLRSQVFTLDKRITAMTRTNLSLAATEGHLQVVNDLAIELSGLVVSAGNRGALGDNELAGIQTEVSGIIDGLKFLEQTSRFQGASTITGSIGSALDELRAGGALNLIDGDLEGAQDLIESFVEGIAKRRANIGNQIKSNESVINASRIEFEEVTGALSLVEDADFAKEIATLVRGQALQQAALTTDAIARQQAEVALNLLQSAAQLSFKG